MVQGPLLFLILLLIVVFIVLANEKGKLHSEHFFFAVLFEAKEGVGIFLYV